MQQFIILLNSLAPPTPVAPFSICLLLVGWATNYFTVIMHLKHAVTISPSLS